jgi:hypothetical protein
MILNPIDPQNLRELLNFGIVQFAFKKLDGNLRTALGTTNLDSIPIEDHPSGRGQSPSSVVAYYDLSKNAWRSVSTSKEMFVNE